MAGASGLTHTGILRGRTVYVYADDDEAGKEAKAKWAQEALSAGAKVVAILAPWSADACAVAGSQGKRALADLVCESLELAELFGRADCPAATTSGRTIRTVRPFRKWFK